MLERLKRKLYDVLVDVDVSEPADRIVSICLMALIFANGLAVMLETVKQIEAKYHCRLPIETPTKLLE